MQDDRQGAHIDTQTPMPNKSQLWERFERGFDSLQTVSTVRKDPFRSLSPLSSPGDGGDDPSPNHAPPKMASSWFNRRFTDAFVSDAPSPADASLLSHPGMSIRSRGPMDSSQLRHTGELDGESLGSLSSNTALREEEGPQRQHSLQFGQGRQNVDHPLQQGSEVSEEMSGSGGDARRGGNHRLLAPSERGEERSTLDDSFMLRMNKKIKNAAGAESGMQSLVDGIYDI